MKIEDIIASLRGHLLGCSSHESIACRDAVEHLDALVAELQGTKAVLRDTLDERPDLAELHALREEVQRLRAENANLRRPRAARFDRQPLQQLSELLRQDSNAELERLLAEAEATMDAMAERGAWGTCPTCDRPTPMQEVTLSTGERVQRCIFCRTQRPYPARGG